MPDPQKMVLEFRIYPGIPDEAKATKYAASIISFDRADLSTDLVNATEMGLVCVINTVRHVRANGFSDGPCGKGSDIILPPA